MSNATSGLVANYSEKIEVFDSHLRPKISNTYSLGTTSSAWLNLYGTASWSVSASWAPGGTPTFSGETNNYFPQWNSNTLTSTSSIFSVSSSVGINTTILSARSLTVKDNGQTGNYVEEIHANDNNPWATGWFNDTYSTTVPIASVFGQNFGDTFIGVPRSLTFYVNNSFTNLPLSLSSSGKVGIGTTNPQSLLHVQGAISCSNVQGSSSYSSKVKGGPVAWASISQSGTTLTSTTFNCSVSRISVGNYGIIFNPSLADATYCVNFTGMSGSFGRPTASLGAYINPAATGFTMSVVTATAAATAADFSMASITVLDS